MIIWIECIITITGSKRCIPLISVVWIVEVTLVRQAHSPQDGLVDFPPSSSRKIPRLCFEVLFSHFPVLNPAVGSGETNSNLE